MTDLLMQGGSSPGAEDDSMLEDPQVAGQEFGALAGAQDVDMLDTSSHHRLESSDHHMAPDETDLPILSQDKQDSTMDDDTSEVSRLHHQPAFRSPPAIQTWDEGREVQAMGHGGGAEEVLEHADTPIPTTGDQQVDDTKSTSKIGSLPPSPPQTPFPRSVEAGGSSTAPNKTPELANHQRRREPDTEDVLVTQDQDRGKDDTQQQSQSIEKHGEHGASFSTSQQLGEKGHEDEQRTRIDVEQVDEGHDGSPELRISADQQNHADESDQHRKITQINEVHVHRTDDCASSTHASGALKRLPLDKSPLANVRFSNEDDGADEELLMRKPPISLAYWNTSYLLFRPREEIRGEDEEDGEKDDRQVLLEGANEKRLYFGQLEHIFAALHEAFPAIDAEGSELTLKITSLGLEIKEDSVYSREISLYDIDRIFVGAQIGGELHIDLEDSPGFVRRFNDLAKLVEASVSQHSKNSPAGEDDGASALGSETHGDLEYANEAQDDGAVDTAEQVAADDQVSPTEVLEGAIDVGQAAQDDDEATDPPDADGPDVAATELNDGEGADLLDEGGDAFDTSIYTDALEGQDHILSNGHVEPDKTAEQEVEGSVRRSSRLSAKSDTVAIVNGDDVGDLSTEKPLGSVTTSQNPSSPKRSRESIVDGERGVDTRASLPQGHVVHTPRTHTAEMKRLRSS